MTTISVEFLMLLPKDVNYSNNCYNYNYIPALPKPPFGLTLPSSLSL